MAHLGGQFAGMLQIDVASADVDSLVASLKQLERSDGLTVTAVCDESPQQAQQPSVPGGEIAKLELVGQDRPGIVRNIATAVAARGANVEDLATECFSAPMSGETMFKASARLHLPSGIDLATIQQELEAIALDLVVDLRLDPESS